MKINRLDEIFKEKKIYNRYIAKYLGKDETTVSKWRNNKQQPSLYEFWEIAKLLRINFKDLFESTTWKDETSETYTELVLRLKNENKNNELNQFLGTKLEKLISEGKLNTPITSKMLSLELDNHSNNHSTTEITKALNNTPLNEVIIKLDFKYANSNIYIHKDYAHIYQKMMVSEIKEVIEKKDKG